MAQEAPAASALARSPEYLMPPSAMTGMPLLSGGGCVHDGGELGHADARDDPGRADRARADADLDRIRAGIDQRLGAAGGGDVAGDDLNGVGELLHPRDRLQHLGGMAMGGVDDDDIDAASISSSERSKPRSPVVVAAATSRRPCESLAALGWATCFSMSLTVIRPMQR
jgi:hypothetical protein